MKLEKLSKILERTDLDIKVDKAYWLINTTKCYSMPDGLKDEFLTEEIDRIRDVLVAMGLTLSDDELQELDAEQIIDMIHDQYLTGFLLQAATPIPSGFDGDGGFRTNGFGYYTTKWFYTEDFERFAYEAVEWSESVLADYRQKEAKA